MVLFRINNLCFFRYLQHDNRPDWHVFHKPLLIHGRQLSSLGSWQGQSSHGLGNWKADLSAWQRVSEVGENSKEKNCPPGHKSSKMVWPSSWTDWPAYSNCSFYKLGFLKTVQEGEKSRMCSCAVNRPGFDCSIVKQTFVIGHYRVVRAACSW